MRQRAPGRQKIGEVSIRLLGGCQMAHRVESGSAAWGREQIAKQMRRSRMIFRPTGPVNALQLLDLVICDAGIIRDAASGGVREFLKDLFRIQVIEILSASQALGKLA